MATTETPTLEINSQKIDKTLINKAQEKAYEHFAKKIEKNKDKKDTKDITEAFNDHAGDVLEGIKQNMLNNFSKIDQQGLTSYIQAKKAFDTEIDKHIKEQEGKDNKTTKPVKERQTTTKETDDVYSLSANTSSKEKESPEKSQKESKKIQKLKTLKTIIHDIGIIIQLKKLEINTSVDANDYKNIDELKNFMKTNNITNEIINAAFIQIQEKQTKMKTEQTEKETQNATQAAIDKKLNDTEKGAAERFFETDEITYNAILEKIVTEQIPPNKDTITINNKSTDTAAKLYKRVAKYTNISPEKLGDIKLGKAINKISNRFPENTRVISYGPETNKGFIVRGTEEHKQEIIAKKRENQITQANIDRTKKYRVDGDFKITETEPDKEKKAILGENTINLFDDIGNFQAFKNYITTQPKETVRTNLGQIIEQINKYKPSADSASAKEGNVARLKNGYANVLTQYIIDNKADQAMMEIYTKYLTIENINILGNDQVTRIANYNKLVPELKKLENTPAMSKETQKRIIELGITIGAAPKMTPENMISKGFDALVEQFGPMLFSVLKMFGFGKGSLLKMFGPGAKDKINALYKKEYGLSSEEMTAIDNTIKDIQEDIPGIKDKEGKLIKIQRTGKELQKVFTQKNAYIKNLANSENCKYINVLTFKTGLDNYNKKNNSDIKISDILTITTDEKTKQQSINNINDNKNFTNVMNSLLDNETTRSKIASANADIMTKTPSKVQSRGDNEYVQNIDTRYAITSQQDIARYLTASLFSTKDLAYVMTENELHNGKEIKNKKIEKKYIVDNADGINLRDTKNPNNKDGKGLENGEEIIAMLDKEGKEIITTAKELNLSAEEIGSDKKTDLSKEIYQKIKTQNDKEWRVAKKFIKEKTVPTETASSTPTETTKT